MFRVTYSELEDEEGEEWDGHWDGKTGQCEGDAHHQQAAPHYDQVREGALLVQAGGHLGPQHQADHEGAEHQTEGEGRGGGVEDRSPQEHEDVHGRLGTRLHQSHRQDIPVTEDGGHPQLVALTDGLLAVSVILLPTEGTLSNY